jgi:hypothetical protein
MNPADLQRFIEEDLYNELRWLLVAASEWNAATTKDVEPANHFLVVTMDSTFLHARSLYEFFIDAQILNPQWNPKQNTAYAKRDFNISIAPTSTYTRYIDGIHKRLFHLDINRPSPEKRGVPIPGKDINDKVMVVAQDVLDLWDNFAAQAPSYTDLMNEKRSEVIQEAHEASKSCGYDQASFN